MTKLFWYELKRLHANQFFLGSLFLIAFFSWQVLSGEIILGIAQTAPFSPWSFGYYLSRILPLLLIVLLFSIAFFSSEQERQVQAITLATPVNQGRYLLIRCGAMIVGYLLLSFFTIVMSLVFNASLFQYTSFGDFIVPAVFTLFPVMLFTLGIGLVAGEIHPALIYVMMIVMLLLGFLPLPYWADLMGGSFFAGYPSELGVLDPSFGIPADILASRCIFSLLGIALVLAVARRRSNTCSVD